MKPNTMTTNDKLQTGFSLVELMVGIAIGLMMMTALIDLFISNSQSRGEIEQSNRQVENGRYALQALTDDLRLAGFYGEFDPTVLTAPSTKPDPCLTAASDLIAALPLHIQAYDNVVSTNPLSCLSDVKTGTDVIVIRRVSSCIAGTTDCDGVTAGTPYFQASLCNNLSELGSGASTDFFALDSNTGNLTRHKKDCTTLADFRRYRTHIYFIANNDVADDGIPTLKRAELGANGSRTAFTIVPIAEGIENLQLEYGIDTTNDGAADAYTADPDSYGACAGVTCVANWQNSISVKINLLARNTEFSLGYTDTKTYTLGLKADGSLYTVSAPNDNYRRHAFQSVVRLNNPAGRKEP